MYIKLFSTAMCISYYLTNLSSSGECIYILIKKNTIGQSGCFLATRCVKGSSPYQ